MTTTTTSTREFFIVQKCWFDGPHVEPPLDYLRLFGNAHEAEVVAHQSASTFAQHHHAVVRTVLLPQSMQRGSAYAFSAAGRLFWVRKIQASVSGGSEGHKVSAHAVLTAGVIGGNKSNRRGFEVNEGRVFVGPQSAQWALGVAQQMASSDTYVTWMPLEAYGNWMDGWPGAKQPVLEATKRAPDGMGERPAKRHCIPRSPEAPTMQYYHHDAIVSDIGE